MARSRPISYHLKKSCTREKQVQKAQEWAKQWHDETFEEIINHLQGWLRDMERGVSVAVTKPYLACRITHQNGKSIGFMLSFIDDDMAHTDIVEMVVCRHSRYRVKAWKSIGGGNKPAPSLPFLAVRLLVSEQEMLRLGLNIDDILMLGSFEQSIAWTWLASKEQDNEQC